MAESIKLKEILHLMKLRVLLYGWPCFSEMRPASLLKAIVAEGPSGESARTVYGPGYGAHLDAGTS